MLSNLTTRLAGIEDIDCTATFGGIIPIDEITFDVANPDGLDLRGAILGRRDVTAGLAALNACGPSMCHSVVEGSGFSGAEACVVSGATTSKAMQVRFFNRTRYRPIEAYDLTLTSPVTGTRPAITSNAVSSTIVRLPGASNDHPALIEFDGHRNGPTLNVGLSWFVPVTHTSAEGVEMELTYYDRTGRLFARTRYTLTSNVSNTTAGVFDATPSKVGPPWRLVVALRQTIGSTRPPRQPERCNDDGPYSTEGPCSTQPLPPSTGSVVWETSQEFQVN